MYSYLVSVNVNVMMIVCMNFHVRVKAMMTRIICTRLIHSQFLERELKEALNHSAELEAQLSKIHQSLKVSIAAKEEADRNLRNSQEQLATAKLQAHVDLKMANAQKEQVLVL